MLNKISKDKNQSPSTVGSQIISQWIEFYYYKIHRGDVIFSRHVIKKLISILDKSKIEKVSEFMANHIIKEIRLQEGNVTYPVLTEHILKWNRGNSLKLNKITKKDAGNYNDSSDMFISKHSLGCNWSELECKTYTKAFEKIGQTVTSIEYDEDSFCFSITNRYNK